MTGYDQMAAANHWHPAAIFGLCFEYLRSGQRLLDVGTGTGLAAESFARAGLQVYGFDTSPEMLAVCASKRFAVELKQHDLLSMPWPYAGRSFDHVIACGVLHFVGDLAPIFREVDRLLRPGGVFAFSTKAPPALGARDAAPFVEEIIQDTTLYQHQPDYLRRCLSACGFAPVKELRLLVTTGRQSEDVFLVYVVRRV